jgi:hypothetical protein
MFVNARAGLLHPGIVSSLGVDELSRYAERAIRCGAAPATVSAACGDEDRWRSALLEVARRLVLRPLRDDDRALLEELALRSGVLFRSDPALCTKLIHGVVRTLPDDADTAPTLEPWLRCFRLLEPDSSQHLLEEILERRPTGALLRAVARAVAESGAEVCAPRLADVVAELLYDYRELVAELAAVVPVPIDDGTTELVEREIEIGETAREPLFLGIENALVERGLAIEALLGCLVDLGATCDDHLEVWRSVAVEGPDSVGWESSMTLLARSAPFEARVLARRFCGS